MNRKGVCLSLQAEFAQTTEQGFGVIVSSASIWGVVGNAKNAAYTAYTASKHGVVDRTQSAAIAYASHHLVREMDGRGDLSPARGHRHLTRLMQAERLGVLRIHAQPVAAMGGHQPRRVVQPAVLRLQFAHRHQAQREVRTRSGGPREHALHFLADQGVIEMNPLVAMMNLLAPDPHRHHVVELDAARIGVQLLAAQALAALTSSEAQDVVAMLPAPTISARIWSLPGVRISRGKDASGAVPSTSGQLSTRVRQRS